MCKRGIARYIRSLGAVEAAGVCPDTTTFWIVGFQRKKNFVKRISPANRASQAHKNNPFNNNLLPRQVLFNERHVF